MAHQVMWESVVFTKKNGEDVIVHRGADVPEWMDDEFTLFALTTAGALQVVDRPTANPKNEEGTELVESDDKPLAHPSTTDSKDVWVAYASDPRNPKRISKEEASNMPKAALVERFKA